MFIPIITPLPILLVEEFNTCDSFIGRESSGQEIEEMYLSGFEQIYASVMLMTDLCLKTSRCLRIACRWRNKADGLKLVCMTIEI